MENSENSDANRSRLFRKCIDDGWRAGRKTGNKWVPNELITALKATSHSVGEMSHPRTYKNRWDGKTASLPTAEAMSEVFFGSEPEDPVLKAKFGAAWIEPKRVSRRGSPVDLPEIMTAEPDPDEVIPPASRYAGRMVPELIPPDKPHPLFALKIDPPPQDSTEAAFDLLPDLRPGFVRVPGVARHLGVGLNRVTIDFVTANCDAVGPRAGDGNTRRAGIQQGAGKAWDYVGPKDTALTDIFNEVLARLVWTQQDAPPSATLIATAYADDLAPRALEEVNEDRDLWTGVRDAWVTQMTKRKLIRNGKINLGEATLRWKPKS